VTVDDEARVVEQAARLLAEMPALLIVGANCRY